MIIHKLICDECGKEKDLTTTYYGGTDDWQTLHEHDNQHNRTKTINLCSMGCVFKYLDNSLKA